MENNCEPESRNAKVAWNDATPAAVSKRLREVFPDLSFHGIAEFVEPCLSVSSETVRRYMNGGISGSKSLMFLSAVSSLSNVRFEWLCTGRGAMTDVLERRRVIDSLTPNDLVLVLLERAAHGEFVFIEKQDSDEALSRTERGQQINETVNHREGGGQPLIPQTVRICIQNELVSQSP